MTWQRVDDTRSHTTDRWRRFLTAQLLGADVDAKEVVERNARYLRTAILTGRDDRHRVRRIATLPLRIVRAQRRPRTVSRASELVDVQHDIVAAAFLDDKLDSFNDRIAWQHIRKVVNKYVRLSIFDFFLFCFV